jgi:hypothetical protein
MYNTLYYSTLGTMYSTLYYSTLGTMYNTLYYSTLGTIYSSTLDLLHLTTNTNTGIH